MAKYTLKDGHARTFILGIPRRVGEHIEISNLDMLTPGEKVMIVAHFDCIGEDGQRHPVSIQDSGKNSTENKENQNAKNPVLLSNGLTPEQAREKLIAAGIVFADSIPDEELVELYNKTFSANPPDIKNQKPKKKDQGNKSETLSNGLTPEQAREKLIAAGIVFADSIPDEELVELYNKTFSANQENDKTK